MDFPPQIAIVMKLGIFASFDPSNNIVKVKENRGIGTHSFPATTFWKLDKHGTQMTYTNSLVTCHQRTPLETIQLCKALTLASQLEIRSMLSKQCHWAGRSWNGMVDKKVLDHTVKKKDQVVTFDTRSSVKTGKESVLIDAQLLF